SPIGKKPPQQSAFARIERQRPGLPSSKVCRITQGAPSALACDLVDTSSRKLAPPQATARPVGDCRALGLTLPGKWRRIEQAMDMHDKVAHVRVVHRALRRRLPGRVGLRVARKDADDIKSSKVVELNLGQRLKLAAEDEMQELLGSPGGAVANGHGYASLSDAAALGPGSARRSTSSPNLRTRPG